MPLADAKKTTTKEETKAKAFSPQMATATGNGVRKDEGERRRRRRRQLDVKSPEQYRRTEKRKQQKFIPYL